MNTEKQNFKSLLKLYLKLIVMPFIIFFIVFLISLYFAPTPKIAFGYFLIIFSLFIIVALRNFYIILNIERENKEGKNDKKE